MLPLPIFYAGPAGGPAVDEATAAAQWNLADLPALEGAVGLASAQHVTWSAALATAQGSMPRVTQLLLDPAVPGLLATLATACSDFTRDVAAQRATPGVTGFHVARASHDRVHASVTNATLVSELGPAGPLATIGSAFLALPASVQTTIEASTDSLLRLLTRLPVATIAVLGTIPAEVIDIWDVKPPTDIASCITNAASTAAEVTLCRAAFTTLSNNTPSITHFPDAMVISTKKDVWEQFKVKIAEARAPAIATRKGLLAETGGADGAGTPNCTQLWFMSPPAAAAITARVVAGATAPGRFKVNVGTLAAFLQATPPHGTHNRYWYLSEHLAKPGSEIQKGNLDRLLAALAANAPGWTPTAAMNELLDAAVYAFHGLGQASITPEGVGTRGRVDGTRVVGGRGAGVLATVRYDPVKVAAHQSAWMTFLSQLRALAVGPRHVHPSVRADLHSTDPAKLGQAGSETSIAPDRKPGNRTLTGASQGYEYSIPAHAGSRLIEVPRNDVVNWSDASWYLSLGHYASYQLITDVP